MARIKAPKTFKELLKKCFNPDLSVNEKYMEKFDKTNRIDELDGNEDFGMNSIDIESMKDLLKFEKEYKKEIAGLERFFPFFLYGEDDIIELCIYYYRKKAAFIPQRTWRKKKTNCWGYQISYDILNEFVRKYIYPVEKKEKNIIQDDFIKSRSEILEIED
jgi:hypothetical protein